MIVFTCDIVVNYFTCEVTSFIISRNPYIKHNTLCNDNFLLFTDIQTRLCPVCIHGMLFISLKVHSIHGNKK